MEKGRVKPGQVGRRQVSTRSFQSNQTHWALLTTNLANSAELTKTAPVTDSSSRPSLSLKCKAVRKLSWQYFKDASFMSQWGLELWSKGSREPVRSLRHVAMSPLRCGMSSFSTSPFSFLFSPFLSLCHSAALQSQPTTSPGLTVH